MSVARLRLVVAAAVFLGWLAWLAVAVGQKGTVQIVSRAQLTAATHLIVAEVRVGADGRPLSAAVVKDVLRAPDGDRPAGEITVGLLPAAATPLPVQGETRTPPPGEYLLPLVRDATGFRLAGLPRSPGFEGATPDRPLIYPWTADVQTQLRKYRVIP